MNYFPQHNDKNQFKSESLTCCRNNGAYKADYPLIVGTQYENKEVHVNDRQVFAFRLCNNALKHFAFTLAEVLITLGIIGIIAALTLPALTAKTRKIEYTAKLKKFNSSMMQAITLSSIDNGEVDNWEKTPLTPGDENGPTQADRDATKKYFMKYLAPYIKYNSIKEKENLTQVVFTDGSVVFLRNGSCTDFNYDINGERSPNKYGYDRFLFLICEGNEAIIRYGKGRNFGAYTPGYGTDRESIVQRCALYGEYCSYLLELDNWEFKEDYPYKI